MQSNHWRVIQQCQSIYAKHPQRVSMSPVFAPFFGRSKTSETHSGRFERLIG